MEFDKKVNIDFDEAKAQIAKTLQEIKESKAEIYGFDEARELAKD